MKALHIFSNVVGKTLFLPAIMVLLALTTSLAQAPANDLCSGAITIACGQTVTGSTLNATIDQAPVCTGMTIAKYGVWYSFAGNGQRVTLSTCGGASWDTQIGVYSGSCAALTCVAGNNNACGRQSRVSFVSAVGTTYYIWVTGVIDARGNFSLSATCSPANDDCADAFTITCGQTVSASTTGATADAVGTCGTALNTAGGVWYNLTPAATGDVTVSLCGSGYDTRLGVFSGACGALTCVAGNDDFCSLQSQVTFAATAGTTYRILVTGFSSNTGSFTLNVTCAGTPPPPPPVTCNCTNTTSFGSANAPTTPTTATISTVQYAGEYATISNAVAGSTYVFTSSNATDYLTVRTGSSSGTALACGVTPLTVTPTASGTLYLHINTNAACGTESVSRTTTVTCSSCLAPTAPANDDCSGAIALSVGTTCSFTQYTTTGATASAGAPAPGCALYNGGDVWFSVVVPASGHLILDSQAGVITDGGMAIYSGTCGSLTLIECDDDDSANGLMSFINRTGLTPGSTIYVRFWEYNNDNPGTFSICARNGTPPTLTAPTNATAELAGEVVGLPEGALTVGQVFPNPLVGSTANIRVDSPKETEAIVRFMDQMGREVMMIESDLNVGDNLLQLNISRLPAGTYFVMVQVEGKVIPRRLVVPRS
jgi:hypothetical protein